MPTFQWHPDPALELADQKYFSTQLDVGQIVAGDIDNSFQSGWPTVWQDAAQTWGKTPEEIREAVRAYGQWLVAVADHNQATDARTEAADPVAADASDTSDDTDEDVTTVDTLNGCGGQRHDDGSALTRRVDGRAETAADTRFFDVREAGYTGPIDQDGYPVPADDPGAQILARMQQPDEDCDEQ